VLARGRSKAERPFEHGPEEEIQRGRIGDVGVAIHHGPEPGLPFDSKRISIQDCCVIVTRLNVCVVVWRDETRVEDVRRVSDELYGLAMVHPEGVGLLQLIDDRSESLSLSPEARSAIASLLARGRPFIKCSTIVFGGEGFRASAVRAIVTGIAWLVRPGFPHQVFAKTAYAVGLQAAHLAPRGLEKTWSDQLVKTVEAARDLTVPAPHHLASQEALGFARRPT
jgi:hypothetical protein